MWLCIVAPISYWSILPKYKSAEEQLILEMYGDPIAVGKLLW